MREREREGGEEMSTQRFRSYFITVLVPRPLGAVSTIDTLTSRLDLDPA